LIIIRCTHANRFHPCGTAALIELDVLRWNREFADPELDRISRVLASGKKIRFISMIIAGSRMKSIFHTVVPVEAAGYSKSPFRGT